MPCNPSYTTEDVIECIEKDSNAVIMIKPPDDSNTCELEIAGSDIAVTIALSLLENYFQEARFKELDTNNHSTSPWNEGPSQRLQDGLERALSHHSDGCCSAEDYSLVSDSVKRVILHCLGKDESLQLSDDSDLFGIDEGANGVPVCENGNVFVNDFSNLPSAVETDAVYPDLILVPSAKNGLDQVNGLTQQLTDATISNAKSPGIDNGINKSFYIRYGKSAGYEEDEVCEALNFVDEKTCPSDFLELLARIKKTDNRHMGGNECDSSVPLSSLMTEKRSTSPPSDVDLNLQTLPLEYRRLKDMAEENENSSVHDLKKRNAERQLELRRAFQEDAERQRNVTGAKSSERSYTSSNSLTFENDLVDLPVSNVPKKDKYSHNSDSKPQKRSKKGKNAVKKVKNSCEVLQDTQDEETCVMELWSPNVSECNKKNSRTSQSQAMYSRQPKELMPRKAYTAAVAAKPSRGQERTPRYIVIDGSNVAME